MELELLRVEEVEVQGLDGLLSRLSLGLLGLLPQSFGVMVPELLRLGDDGC